jgi:hypothetical protein
MPQIIVTADRTNDRGESAVMLRERVTAADFESQHFAAQLVERLGWAVGDAQEVEREADAPLEAEAEAEAEVDAGFEHDTRELVPQR